MRPAKLAPLAVILALVGSFISLLNVQKVEAAPVTFTVQNTNDSGAGSLRQAILSANGNGNPADQDVIEFDINADAPGDVTIEPLSGLTITQSVLIDGYTQGDASPNTTEWPEPFDNTLRVIIDNSSSPGFVVTGDDVTILGLVINNDRDADITEDPNITVNGASGFQLFGTYLNTTSNGLQLAMDRADETKSLVLNNADDAQIGGAGAVERNIFGYCAISCIEVSGPGSTNVAIQGNYVGLGSDGATSLDTTAMSQYVVRMHAVMILDGASDVTLGGTAAGEGNSFERNVSGAISVEDSSLVMIYGNRINYNFANNGFYNAGILFRGVTDSFIGSTAGEGKNVISGNQREAIGLRNSDVDDDPTSNIVIEGNNIGVLSDDVSSFPNYEAINAYEDTEEVLITENIIHNNSNELTPVPEGGFGVKVFDTANDISILGNSIYNNADQGISLNFANPEDNGDNDDGPNDGLNRPGYTDIVEDGGNTEVTFTADLPAGDYRIEFFDNTVADPDFPGEGETFIGHANITSFGTGLDQYDHTLTGTGYTNMSLTATERNVDTDSGYGATSEFGMEGQDFTPVRDLAMTQFAIDDTSAAKSVGQTVAIDVQINNAGANPINLADFDGTTLAGDYFFMVALNDGLTYSSVTGSNVACEAPIQASDGSFSGMFANHSDHSIVVCSYTGGVNLMNPGDTLSYTINATVTTARMPEINVAGLVRANEFDPEYTDYQAAITSGNDIIDELTSSGSDNLQVYTLTLNYVTDLAVAKRIVNPEDFANGNTIEYEITVTNVGPDEIDLAYFDDWNPGNNRQLITDIFPEQLAFDSASSNLDCFNLGDAGDAFGSLMANHGDHTIVSCAYQGGTNILQSGDSESFTVSATVVDDAEPVFYNYVLASSAVGDPDGPAIGGLAGGGGDLIDGLMNSGINNFAFAYSRPTDISLSKVLDNPEDAAPGATLTYTLTVTNSGSMPIDPNVFDGSGMNPLPNLLFIDLMPANVTFVSQSNTDMSCIGPAPASSAGPLFSSHSDHTFIGCSYNGPITSLAPDESISTTITVTASSVPDGFTNKAITFGSIADEDFFAFISFMNSGIDMLDLAEDLGTNNFVMAAYNAPDPDPGPGDGGDAGNGGSDANGNSAGGGGLLDQTGQAVWVVIPAAVLLMALIALVAIKRRTRSGQ